MFIVIGTKDRLTDAIPSEILPAACPHCKGDLVLKHSKTWGTLFFIPVIPVSNNEPCYQCNQCKGTFRKDIKAYLQDSGGDWFF